jgi:hypothetical protein
VALADGVESNPIMVPYYDAVGSHDPTFVPRQKISEEMAEIYFAYEAETLRILFLGRRKLRRAGHFPHLGFGIGSQGKKAMFELLVIQAAQEIGLVFILVNALQEFLGVVGRVKASVVAGGDIVGARLQGFFKEKAEFDFSIAHHIRVGCPASGIFPDHGVKHQAFIFRPEIEGQKGNV